MPRSGLVITTAAPESAAREAALTVPVIDPVVAHAAPQNVTTNSTTCHSIRSDFMVTISPHWRGRGPARVQSASRTSEPVGARGFIFDGHFYPVGLRPETGY